MGKRLTSGWVCWVHGLDGYGKQILYDITFKTCRGLGVDVGYMGRVGRVNILYNVTSKNM